MNNEKLFLVIGALIIAFGIGLMVIGARQHAEYTPPTQPLPPPNPVEPTQSSAAVAQTTPFLDDWDQLKSSTKPGDVSIVAKIEKMEWWDLCARFGIASRSKKQPHDYLPIQSYLDHNKFTNGLDYEGISRRAVTVGMTTCGAYAAIGLPSHVNRTQNKYGNHDQHVFRDRNMYIYTDSSPTSPTGLVQSIQY